MRLLFIDFTLPQLLRDAEFPAGGWAVQLSHLLVGLSETGHRVGVLTWKGANAYAGPQSLCELLETYDPQRGIRKLRFFTSFLPSLYAAARRWRPDVILQSCSGMDTATMALIARSLHVPFVHRIASNPDTDGRYVQYLDWRSRIGFRFGLKRADLVICQNAYQLGHIGKAFPHKPAAILHNCIHIPPAAVAPPGRAQRTYIAWVGNFAPPKNVPLLSRIAQQLPEIEFRIAGALPASVKDRDIAMALKTLEALQNVRFAGYLNRSAIADFLRGATALLCTSDFEGFSNTFLEAFAAGTPVVLRSAVDPDGIVARNTLGVAARDGTELADCVKRMTLLDPASYDAVSVRCRRYVEAHHSSGEAVRNLLSMLEPLREGKATA